jgi:predicted CXXCH cytochrome family protein
MTQPPHPPDTGIAAGPPANLTPAEAPAEQRPRPEVGIPAEPNPPAIQAPESAVPPPEAPRQRLTWLLAAGALAVVAVAGVLLWMQRGAEPDGPGRTSTRSPAAPPDPRLTYKGLFENIHPSVKYVGSAVCKDCHLEIAESFSRHPMSRSVQPIAKVASGQRYDQAVHNPFDALGARFLVVPFGPRVWHRESRLDEKGQPVYERDLEVHYAIGSGNHGYSYLTERDGFLFQTPVSWYSQKKIWDISPGFSPPLLPGRPVLNECLFCHADRVEPYEGLQNRYHEPVFRGHVGIGCERCHGPGEKHVATGGARMGRKPRLDPTIVNPRHLHVSLREAVCEQCHLEGDSRVLRRGRALYDFRPGLPLQDFWSVLVQEGETDEGPKAVSHVEQMYLSGCFKGGRGADRMGCISCHDPHERVSPAQRVSHYRARCLNCHQEKEDREVKSTGTLRGCSEPLAKRRVKSKDNSCIDCHMARYTASDVVHAASTDHRILRRPEKERPKGAGHGASPHLTHFYRERNNRNDREGARDLALALGRLALQGPGGPEGFVRPTLDLIEGGLRDFPNDVEALEVKAHLLLVLERPGQALATLEKVLALSPAQERSLMMAAHSAWSIGEKDKALTYSRRLVALNPWDPSYRRALGAMLVQERRWKEAAEHARVWRTLEPSSVEARMLWTTALLRQGRRAEAQAEMNQIEALRPPNLAGIREWFNRLPR